MIQRSLRVPALWGCNEKGEGLAELVRLDSSAPMQAHDTETEGVPGRGDLPVVVEVVEICAPVEREKGGPVSATKSREDRGAPDPVG